MYKKTAGALGKKVFSLKPFYVLGLDQLNIFFFFAFGPM